VRKAVVCEEQLKEEFRGDLCGESGCFSEQKVGSVVWRKGHFREKVRCCEERFGGKKGGGCEWVLVLALLRRAGEEGGWYGVERAVAASRSPRLARLGWAGQGWTGGCWW